MTSYQVNVSVNIYAVDEPGGGLIGSNSLYHNQSFKISGDKFADVAPTIDGIYAAIHQVVEANGGHSN